MLRLRTFGGLSLVRDDGTLTGAAAQRRPLALLAILAASGEHGIGREQLQLLLWPESDTERARKVLAQTVYAIRRDLGSPGVIQGTTELRLNTGLVSTDIADFVRALETGRFEQAAVLYKGPFLDGVHLPQAIEFERWADAQRDRLARQMLEMLERLACASEKARDWEVAAGWWSRRAVLDPLSARATVRLMDAMAAAGDMAGALRQARAHERLLHEEFGAAADPIVSSAVARLRTPSTREAATAAPARPGPAMSWSRLDVTATLPAQPPLEPSALAPQPHEAPLEPRQRPDAAGIGTLDHAVPDVDASLPGTSSSLPASGAALDAPRMRRYAAGAGIILTLSAVTAALLFALRSQT